MCTTIIVGKAVSKTGRVIVGHSEDSGGRVFHQQFYVPGGKHAAGAVHLFQPAGIVHAAQLRAVLSGYKLFNHID